MKFHSTSFCCLLALLLCAGAAWGATREERILEGCAKDFDYRTRMRGDADDQAREPDEAARVRACADWLQSRWINPDNLYTFMLKHAENEVALRAGQERWQREAAESKDLKNLVSAYIRRMDELWSAPAIADTPLDEIEARAISEEIVALSNTGALREYLLPPFNRKDVHIWIDGLEFFLRLGKDGRLAPYSIIFTGGTCASTEFLPLNPDGTISKDWDVWAARYEDRKTVAEVADDDGTHEHPLLYRNRYFVVRTPWCPGVAAGVLEVLPNGRMRHLATTEKKVEEVDLTPPAGRPPVCGAILSGAVRPLQWAAIERPANSDRLHCGPCREDASYGWAVLEEDMDEDGVPEHLGAYEYPTSAGCGGTVSSLFLLDAEHRRILDTPLSQTLQKVFSDWVRSPDDPVRAYRYEGRIYLEKAGYNRICPDDNAARHVYQAEQDGTLREVCTFGRKETRFIPAR